MPTTHAVTIHVTSQEAGALLNGIAFLLWQADQPVMATGEGIRLLKRADRKLTELLKALVVVMGDES
jgi:hypothetical protein